MRCKRQTSPAARVSPALVDQVPWTRPELDAGHVVNDAWSAPPRPPPDTTLKAGCVVGAGRCPPWSRKGPRPGSRGKWSRPSRGRPRCRPGRHRWWSCGRGRDSAWQCLTGRMEQMVSPACSISANSLSVSCSALGFSFMNHAPEFRASPGELFPGPRPHGTPSPVNLSYRETAYLTEELDLHPVVARGTEREQLDRVGQTLARLHHGLEQYALGQPRLGRLPP